MLAAFGAGSHGRCQKLTRSAIARHDIRPAQPEFSLPVLPALGVTLQAVRKARKAARRTAMRSEKTLREQAEQIASDRAALRMGPGGLESVVPQAEREQLAQQADTLSPFRKGVIFAAFLLLFGGFQDGFWLVVQPKLTSLGLLQVVRTEESQSSSILLVILILAVGAGLLYVGTVLLKPAPLPSLEDVLQEEETREEARKELQLARLSGRWYYGMNLGQSYEISNNQGEWCFSEELAGRKCSCTLRIVGSWVHGDLVDEKGEEVGLIRLRRTTGNSVVSNLKVPGSTTWGNPNEAIGW
ncbi:unnamed protein product [Cladocopium goreaui]|uniref:Uncharacterized protein n=1 Tax=Cladocopium goreaui TaxID=2562237 RepID=A0A9P1G503_9DINO|nr:unnamed protein product [Cladocopium goreaui]